METRIEKYKRRKKEKRIRKLKAIIIFILISIMALGLVRVNQTARDLNVLEDSTIFSYDFTNHRLQWLGKAYVVDVRILFDYLQEMINR